MKPLVGILTILLTTSTSAMHIPRNTKDLISLLYFLPPSLQQSRPLRHLFRPNIPLFILDARHPWILQNHGFLNSHPNISTVLCTTDPSDPSLLSLQSSLQACSLPPTIPPDLFHSLEIDNTRGAGMSRPGWTNAADRLAEMLACPAALRDVRALKVNIYWVDAEYKEWEFADTYRFLDNNPGPRRPRPEIKEPPAEVMRLFARFLAEVGNRSLAKMEWDVPCAQAQFLEREFDRAGLAMGSLRHLVLGGKYSDYLVRMTPRLEVLESGGTRWHCGDGYQAPNGKEEGELLLQAVKGGGNGEGITTLKVGGMGRGEWSTEYLEDILDAMPNLENLTIDGSLGRSSAMGSYEPGMEDALKSYLTVLTKFPKLNCLHLPASSDLSLGFDGGAWCGNAYMGPSGREYGRQVARDSAETIDVATRFILEALPRLTELSFGGLTAEMNLTAAQEGGKPVPRWPWTGRMEEWSFEVYPPWQGGDDDW